MTTVLLIVVLAIDVGLFLCLFFMNRKQTIHGNTLLELTEERKLLEETRRAMQAELQSAQEKNKATLAKVSHIATEIEQEVKHGGQSLTDQLGEVSSELDKILAEPMQQFAKKKQEFQHMLATIDDRKNGLQRLIVRGERLIQFFRKDMPYDEILEDIKDKNYTDARRLLAKGIKPEAVADEVGLDVSEVRLIAGLTVSGVPNQSL